MEELIIRVLCGDATSSEEEKVERWRGESPEHEASFQRALRLWSLTEPRSTEEAPAPPSGEAVARAWQEQREATGDPSVVSISEERQARARPSRALRWTVALAASVAAMALGIQLTRAPGGAPATLAVFEAEAGGSRTVVLDDGSRVRLAAGSRLEQWDARDQRLYGLTGRAFFAVAHDPTMPFVVQAGGAEARVLGTRFELLLDESGLRTVVLDGRVAVSNELGRAEIPAGSVGRAPEGGVPTAEPSEDPYALLDWPEGLLIFQATPLARVAEEVARHFDVIVEVGSDSLRAFRISASFQEEGFEEIVEALCEVVATECAITDDAASIGIVH